MGMNGEEISVDSGLYKEKAATMTGETSGGGKIIEGVFDGQNTINQNGNLTISGTYLLDRETLRMNGTYNGSRRIFVTSSGNFTVLNKSNITNGPANDFRL